jgi:hypothetical protein
MSVIGSVPRVSHTRSTNICRRLHHLKLHIARILGLSTLRLTPHAAALILKFRSEKGKLPPAGTPDTILPAVTGALAKLHIDNVIPRTVCFVQVDLDVFSIRWSPRHFISLHCVEDVQLTQMNSPSMLNLIEPSTPSSPVVAGPMRKDQNALYAFHHALLYSPLSALRCPGARRQLCRVESKSHSATVGAPQDCFNSACPPARRRIWLPACGRSSR